MQVAVLAEFENHPEFEGFGAAGGWEATDHTIKADNIWMVEAEKDIELEVDISNSLLKISSVLHGPTIQKVCVLTGRAIRICRKPGITPVPVLHV